MFIFMVQMSKRIYNISRIFYIFSKFLFSGLLVERKGEKWSKTTKNSVLSWLDSTPLLKDGGGGVGTSKNWVTWGQGGGVPKILLERGDNWKGGGWCINGGVAIFLLVWNTQKITWTSTKARSFVILKMSLCLNASPYCFFLHIFKVKMSNFYWPIIWER